VCGHIVRFQLEGPFVFSFRIAPVPLLLIYVSEVGVRFSITEYALQNAEARPRRIAVAPDDTIYYTDYARGYLGHFDPATRKFEEWPSPGGSGSNPYGIAITRDAVVWYSESGVHPNTLVRFAPKAKTFSSTPIPSGGGVVRNMAATKDGRLYLACSGVNKVAIAQVR